MTEQIIDSSNARPPIAVEALTATESLIGLEFTEAERTLMLESLSEHRKSYDKLRTIALANHVPPAFAFDPRLPGMTLPTGHAQPGSARLTDTTTPILPANLEEVAFWPLTKLARLIETRQVTSMALTEMYLARLKHFDPILHCVVTLTEDLALVQARRADAEIADGKYRGPLHGIPWGAKDLLATRNYPTTFGAAPYKDQQIELDATVVERLEAAGAVLVAKLSLGELAMDDEWFGGLTRNPWNLENGSSGSSAGSASATAAGLVGFSVGTETLGSIVSPSTRCRVSGLRPTFGRVSRQGAMALSWTMDKIGPICRSVEDCALVFDAIYGPDGNDPTVTDYPFAWPSEQKLSDLRVGYLGAAFAEDDEHAARNHAALAVLRGLGIALIPIELPDFHADAIEFLLLAEGAAAFDELTRDGRDDMLARQAKDSWPNIFRAARTIPAVEYIQAQRVRTLLMGATAAIMQTVDVYVAPSFGGGTLLITNMTGHPAVVVPNGLTEKGDPSSITFTGQLYGESAALLLAKAYQDATGFHLERPNL